MSPAKYNDPQIRTFPDLFLFFIFFNASFISSAQKTSIFYLIEK